MNAHIPKQSKVNDIVSGEASSKKRKVLQLATSSYTNLVLAIALEPSIL